MRTVDANIDKSDAPIGYIPLLKSSLQTHDNICNHCDWRKDCDANVVSCMSYKRNDGCGVYFVKEV